ncbi:MAG TPA: FKBP-type peptidyl-prolyl cis-trans isomerase [Bacteroidales bacterium]|nr:FKBP-type peptidyl-prolyl cis-trans isomerase [Bacteroidales bacterium]
MHRQLHEIFFLILLFSVVSCDHFARYPGYKKASHGIYYKLTAIGDEDSVKAKPGDYITVNLTYLTMNDSAFFDGKRKFQVKEPAYEGAIDECFTLLSPEESAVFILSAAKFFENTLHSPLPRFIKTDDPVKVKVDMIDIQTEEDYTREKQAFLSWIQDFGEYEKVILTQFIDQEKLNVSPLPGGMYYLNLIKGNGIKVEKGDTVTVNYEGKFLNGRFFDSTVKRGQPFQFVYGTEWQVIEGLEQAIGMMSEGEKSLFILPSQLAFGNEGSSNQLIPPFTSLIFEVEILKVSSPLNKSALADPVHND